MVVDRYGDVVLDMFRARRQQEDGENSVDAEALGVHMGDDTGGGDGMPAGRGVDATGACAADHCPDLEDVRAHEGTVGQLAAVEVAGNGDGDLASAMVGACGAAPLAGDGAGDGDVSASGGSKARDGTCGRAVLDGSDTGLAGFSAAEVDVDARPSGPVENMQQGGTGDGVGCDHGDGEACDGAGGSTVAASAGTAMAGLDADRELQEEMTTDTVLDHDGPQGSAHSLPHGLSGAAHDPGEEELQMEEILQPEQGATWTERALERWAREGRLY